MPITINLAGVNTDEFAALPPGRYRVSVYACEARRSKAGNSYLNWELRVQEPHEFATRRLWHITMLEPENALFNLKRFLVALGVTEEALNGQFDLEPNEYLGEELVVQVTNEEYEGKMQARIKQVYPASAVVGLVGDLDFETASVPSANGNNL